MLVDGWGSQQQIAKACARRFCQGWHQINRSVGQAGAFCLPCVPPANSASEGSSRGGCGADEFAHSSLQGEPEETRLAEGYGSQSRVTTGCPSTHCAVFEGRDQGDF